MPAGRLYDTGAPPTEGPNNRSDRLLVRELLVSEDEDVPIASAEVPGFGTE